jgi:hypothetical protein
LPDAKCACYRRSVMKRTSRSLRILSALVVALLLYAAVPHRHAAGSAVKSELDLALRQGGDAATPELSADDRHDAHSSTLAGDEHPCALCRAAQGRLHAAPAPTLITLDLARDPVATPPLEFLRAEQLFARRHPARAPPLA